MFDFSLEHIFSFTGKLAVPLAIGPVPEGLRIVFPITGGEATGPRVRGKVLASGGDWFTGRTDGVGILDVRGAIETDDSAVIYMHYMGVADMGEDSYEKALRGEMPALLKLRTAPRFQTAHPDYEWLNRIQAIGIGEAVTGDLEVRYDVYAIR